jgi:hypothetical protein
LELGIYLDFDFWSLEFIWILIFGIWNFKRGDYFVIPFRGAGTSMNTKPFQMKDFSFQALLRSSKLGLYGLGITS